MFFSSLYLVCIALRDFGDRRSINTVLLLLLLLLLLLNCLCNLYSEHVLPAYLKPLQYAQNHLFKRLLKQVFIHNYQK